MLFPCIIWFYLMEVIEQISIDEYVLSFIQHSDSRATRV